MKVVISGASGFIGSSLVPLLTAEGHDVARLVRGEAQAPGEIAWDPEAGSLDHAALAGVEVIVCLSGATLNRRWTDARKREILESRTATTNLLARAATALDPAPRAFLCASGIGAYGVRGDEILTEESERGSGFLADVVRDWEAAAEPAREAGVRVVNFRHGIVFGRGGGALQQMLLPFKLGLGGRIGSGKQWWSWVHMDDLVAAYSFALRSDLVGAVNLVSPNPVTNEQLTRALGDVLHRPTVLPTPTLALKLRFGREMPEEMLLDGQRALPARLLDAGFEFTAPTIDVALERALTA
jgi:uncharacterized protein (TIGR01777 family)